MSDRKVAAPRTPVVEAPLATDYCPPADRNDATGNDRILALGDIDGEPLQIIQFLIKKGVISFTKENYASLAKIYTDLKQVDMAHGTITIQQLSQEKLKLFEKILNTATINLDRIQELLLIGDTLSERGNNDLLTLAVYRWLGRNHIPFSILDSNHDRNFFSSFRATELKYDGTTPPQYMEDLPNVNGQVNSLVQMVSSLRETPPAMTMHEVREVLDQHYLPNLVAIRYSLSANADKMTIYTHAAIDFALIREMALTLGIADANTTTPRELARTIDRINSEYRKWASQPGGLEALIVLDDMRQSDPGHYHYITNPTKNDIDGLQQQYWKIRVEKEFNGPFSQLVWNRRYDNLNRIADHQNFAKQGCDLMYVHGHDSHCRMDSENSRHEDNQPYLLNLDRYAAVIRDQQTPRLLEEARIKAELEQKRAREEKAEKERKLKEIEAKEKQDAERKIKELEEKKKSDEEARIKAEAAENERRRKEAEAKAKSEAKKDPTTLSPAPTSASAPIASPPERDETATATPRTHKHRPLFTTAKPKAVSLTPDAIALVNAFLLLRETMPPDIDKAQLTAFERHAFAQISSFIPPRNSSPNADAEVRSYIEREWKLSFPAKQSLAYLQKLTEIAIATRDQTGTYGIYDVLQIARTNSRDAKTSITSATLNKQLEAKHKTAIAEITKTGQVEIKTTGEGVKASFRKTASASYDSNTVYATCLALAAEPTHHLQLNLKSRTNQLLAFNAALSLPGIAVTLDGFKDENLRQLNHFVNSLQQYLNQNHPPASVTYARMIAFILGQDTIDARKMIHLPGQPETWIRLILDIALAHTEEPANVVNRLYRELQAMNPAAGHHIALYNALEDYPNGAALRAALPPPEAPELKMGRRAAA